MSFIFYSHQKILKIIILRGLISICLLLISFKIYANNEADSLIHLLYQAKGIAKAEILEKVSRLLLSDSPAKSIGYTDELLKYAQLIKNKHFEATAFSLKGTYYLQGNDYLKAIKYYIQALDIFEKIKENKGISSCLNNLGIVSYMSYDFDKAIYYFKRSLVMDSEAGDQNGMAGSYNNLGNIFIQKEKYDSAVAYFFKSYQIHKKLKNISDEGLLLANIGETYAKTGRYGQALQYCLEALKIKEDTHDNQGIAVIMNDLGEIYEKLGQLKKAEYYFIQSLKTGKEYKGDVMVIYFNLAGLYKKTGDFKNAFLYQSLYTGLRDSTYTAEKNKSILEIEEKYETDKKKQQILLLQKESDIKDLKLFQNRIILICIILALLGVLALALFFYNRYKIKTEANKMLALANQKISRSIEEKNILLQEIHHRVKNNLQLVSTLLSWQSEGVKSKKVLSIINEGQSRIQSMALIHECIYQSESLAYLDVKKYFEDLLNYLSASYGNSKNIVVEMHIDNVSLDIDKMVPLGLIVNELVSNAFKYAFLNKSQGSIKLLLEENNQMPTLTVSDDGVGLPGSIHEIKSDSLGLELVSLLVKQLKGVMKVNSGQMGTSFEIIFSNTLNNDIVPSKNTDS